MFAHIAGTGSYLPKKVLTNDEIAKTLDTSDEWIYSHTGIHSRRIAEDSDQTSTMAVEAAMKALDAAKVKPEELGQIIVATSTGDYQGYPSVASLVQGRIGAIHADAFDLQAACAGFVHSLQVARGLLVYNQKPSLVIGSEIMSRTQDWTDRNTCILFGDGAGAAVLGPSEEPGGIIEGIMGSDGAADPPVISRSGGTKPMPEGDPVIGKIRMNGRVVFSFAVKTFADLINRMLDHAKLTFEDLTLVVSHQANARIIEAVARRMGKPLEKFFLNIENIGNTSAASVPIALDSAVRSGLIKRGDLIASVAFGAGLSYGGVLIRW